jgi:acetyltransferase-like isoleucine patch superfamily enzyme
MAESFAALVPQLTFNYTRTMMLRLAGFRIGPRSLLMGPVRMTGQGEPTELLTIGSDSVLTGRLHIDFGARVIIGNRVYIGHDVSLLTVDHEIGKSNMRCGRHALRPISIEDGVWIGSRVTVLPGVRIGAGSVVAAGAVVAHDVERNTLVGGVPARLIRELDSDEATKSEVRPRSAPPSTRI